MRNNPEQSPTRSLVRGRDLLQIDDESVTKGCRPVKRGLMSAALLVAALAAAPAEAQNLITQGTWEGFAMRAADNKFDRCVLYNRTVQALTASPYQMLGVTRDAAGRVGLLIFYDPRVLTRGEKPVRLKLDQRAPVSVPGDVLSDFHVNVAALDPATLAALRDAKAMEATVEGHTIRFELSDIGGVLERLESCVKIYGPRS
jgi:hypothetical protein